MKKYTIDDIKKGNIAIRIDTQEKGRKLVEEMKGFSYAGRFPIESYEDFCIAPWVDSKGGMDGTMCHCPKRYYVKLGWNVIDFLEIRFNNEDILSEIEIY